MPLDQKVATDLNLGLPFHIGEQYIGWIYRDYQGLEGLARQYRALAEKCSEFIEAGHLEPLGWVWPPMTAQEARIMYEAYEAQVVAFMNEINQQVMTAHPVF